jgi:hypothetical protein
MEAILRARSLAQAAMFLIRLGEKLALRSLSTTADPEPSEIS